MCMWVHRDLLSKPRPSIVTFISSGGDAVGMSTVPEVIVARHAGIEVFAVSVITDLGVEGIVEKCSHEEVQKAAAEAQPRMSFIMKELVEQF